MANGFSGWRRYADYLLPPVEHRPCLHFNLNTLFTPRGFRAGNLAPLCQRFNPARPVVEKAKRMKAVAHFPHTVAVRQKCYPLARKQRACMYHPSAPFDFSALPYAADDRLAIVFVWHDAPGVCARRRSVQGRWHRAAQPFMHAFFVVFFHKCVEAHPQCRKLLPARCPPLPTMLSSCGACVRVGHFVRDAPGWCAPPGCPNL